MNITEIMNKDLIKLELEADNKNDAIRELADIIDKTGNLNNKEEYINAVMEREKVFSTGIGMGIAIPHGKTNAVKKPTLAFGRSKKGIDYNSMDGTPAKLFFIIAVPEDSNDEHLRLLAQISRKLMHEELRNNLLNASTAEEILKFLE
ncbi:PTS sugar transporter subunit IIA [Clostridium sp. 19966]|uniref:PTS sugar transporter subunit IIA n=1 Tax=Clostridium sp. 19966 TaxID=2768166 RepID=UPI0028DF11CE|nr:PTS sugar transporter subunit IIA [Clostridium sp. 19966]MDT8718588.1 PTS sugar transporter subunit IIA [Clostridium sp. 19966]